MQDTARIPFLKPKWVHTTGCAVRAIYASCAGTAAHRHNNRIMNAVVVDFLFIVTLIVRVCNCSMFCCTLFYVHSSIAIILMGKRELIALLNMSSWCLVMVERLFLAMPRGCLRFVIVVFPDHTHYFLQITNKDRYQTNERPRTLALLNSPLS